MKWSWFGRAAMALLAALALGLGVTACGVGNIAYMWVVGQQYNQITGFRVDDFTGNLTATQGSPYAANGSKPVYILVKPGGRYVYVINQGSTSTSTFNSSDSGIAVFSVGGTGALTFQQNYSSKGFLHQWAQFDSTGNYLFVLDEYGPPTTDQNGKLVPATYGVITTFAVDPNTGRLTLQTQTASAPSGGAAPTFLPVGPAPLRMLSTGSCLFTVNGGNQTVTPYSVASGQLATVTTGNINIPNATNLTSINGNSSYVVLTDAGPGSAAAGFSTPGTIYPYTVSAGCGLTTFTGAGVANTSGVTDPEYSLLDTSNRYLFVLNATSTSTNATTPFSQISGYDVVTSPTSQLSPIPTQPFVTGAHPVCMVEDPTQKFMYVSNQGGTITGYSFTNTEGTLQNLSRGSQFTVNDNQLGCIALSGSVD